MTSFSKIHFEDQLKQALIAMTEVDASWYGGSRATGTEDEYSDTDIVIVSQSPEVVFARLEELIKPYTITSLLERRHYSL